MKKMCPILAHGLMVGQKTTSLDPRTSFETQCKGHQCMWYIEIKQANKKSLNTCAIVFGIRETSFQYEQH